MKLIDGFHAHTSKELIVHRVKELLKILASEDTAFKDLYVEIIDLIDKKDEKWVSKVVSYSKVFSVVDRCEFCGSTECLSPTRLVPKERGGPLIPINLAMICGNCASRKKTKGAYEWWVLEEGKELPPALEIRYLTTLYMMHKEANTLEMDFNTLHLYCNHCQAINACPGEISPVCVEGIIELNVKKP